MIEDEVRAKRKGTLGKHDKFLFNLHESRRAELAADMFQSAPLWWHRSEDANFVLFIKRNGEILVSLVKGLIPAEPLQQMGVISLLNVTISLTVLDEKLAQIVKDRGVELAE